MNKEIHTLQPEGLWKHFHALTQIPRPSKKEETVIEYMKNFGEGLGLETLIDEVGNVVIRKPATPGMEKKKGVIFQGHLDMVPQKNNDVEHDFEKDPIEAYIDGEWVTANGTTLGADNGIGVAAAMAVLASKDISHGPVEALFTIDEETGMTGAFGLKPNMLKGDILMNLDSETEGELYVGCAGGIDGNFELEYATKPTPENHKAFKLEVKGLKGGHSGMDIILGRGNANKLLFRFLKHAAEKYALLLSSVDGGGLRNAIPREAFAMVVVPETQVDDFTKCVASYENIFKSELALTEPELCFMANESEMPEVVFDEKAQFALSNAVYACPNGVIRMSDSMEGLVETSTNLAKVKSDGKKVMIQCLLRSSVDTAKDDLANMIRSVFELAGAKVDFDGGYPGWKPNMESPILKTMVNVYHDFYGKKPEIRAIHAGLECGLLGGVYPHWDMISFGPTICFPHSPDEKVHIESVKKFWDFLVETLKKVDDK